MFQITEKLASSGGTSIRTHHPIILTCNRSWAISVKSLSTFSLAFAEVSKKYMECRWENSSPTSVGISRSSRSVLLPAMIDLLIKTVVFSFTYSQKDDSHRLGPWGLLARRTPLFPAASLDSSRMSVGLRHRRQELGRALTDNSSGLCCETAPAQPCPKSEAKILFWWGTM